MNSPNKKSSEKKEKQSNWNVFSKLKQKKKQCSEETISTENKEPTKKETKYITEEEYLNGMKEYREKLAANRKLVKEAIAKHIDYNELYPLNIPKRPFPLFPKRHVKHRWFKPNKVFYEVPEEDLNVEYELLPNTASPIVDHTSTQNEALIQMIKTLEERITALEDKMAKSFEEIKSLIKKEIGQR